MSGKSFLKGRAFKAFCRKMVKGGSINNAEGNWISYDASKAMHRDQFFGYKLGTTGKKKGKTSVGVD